MTGNILIQLNIVINCLKNILIYYNIINLAIFNKRFYNYI